MREPLKLAQATIKKTLQTHYAITIKALRFLPIGNDAASTAYRIDANDGVTYFLKVRTRSGFSQPSLVLPRHLYDQGLPHILAPLPTINQALSVMIDEFALILYPFIDGRIGQHVGLSETQWRDFGALMKQVHTRRLPPDLVQIIRREPFAPFGRNLLTELQAAVTENTLTDPIRQEFAAFWRARQDDIQTVIDRVDTLGFQLRQATLPLVPCHADLHTWNVLLDGETNQSREQQWWLVDWDELILAPKERDLMFVIGGIGRDLVSPHETRYFLQGYEDTKIDPLALTYYRHAWAAQDMAEYGARACFTPSLSEESRRDALHGFMDMFEPGNIVDIAFASLSSPHS